MNTGREFSFLNPQDDPLFYPAPPPRHFYDLEGALKVRPELPSFRPMPGDPRVAQLEAQVAKLADDLQQARYYIIQLGGVWPPPTRFSDLDLPRVQTNLQN